MQQTRFTRPARALAVVATAAAAVAAGAAPASATSPHAAHYKIDYAAGDLCSFPVEFQVTDNTAKRAITGQGVTIYTGSFVITAVNTATGASRTYNVSGPVFAHPDGTLTLTGTSMITQVAEDNLGSTFAIVTNGRVTFQPHHPIQSFSGHIAHDVCAELS
jgi:hypothetical protein